MTKKTTPSTTSITLVQLLSELKSSDGAITIKSGVLNFGSGRSIDLATVALPDEIESKKARALDNTIAQLFNMGFGSDDPIDGGDCVESVDQIYQSLVRSFPRAKRARVAA